MRKKFCCWLAIIFVVSACAYAAISESVIHDFTGGSDAFVPYSGLIADANGNLYGTSWGGGGGSNCYYLGQVVGCGAVYELSPSANGWTSTVISSGALTGMNEMVGGLVFDRAGNIYGTATQGSTKGEGGIFELTPANGGWTTMVLFPGVGTYSSLTADAAGNLYGAEYQQQEIFELPKNGGETILYKFSGADGRFPYGSVILDHSGNVFGTTLSGGAYNAGVIFALSYVQGAWQYQLLYSFTGGADGGFPYAGVILDASGNLYGTTAGGGAGNFGTVYELSPSNGSWTETVLHSFSGKDGAGPLALLIHDGNGNLYSTTEQGGAHGYGTVFAMRHGSSGWTEVVLHSFAGGDDGEYPYAPVLLYKGQLFGTTSLGGAADGGVAFQIAAGRSNRR